MRRAVLLGLALWPGIAAADEIFIRGGGQLTGEVIERGPDAIVVDIGTGRIGLLLSSVERILPGATPLTRYRERAAGLEPDDVAGWLALAGWARDQGLDAQARESLENVLAAEPANGAARRALGHVQVEGEWMTRDESYQARGLVRHEGSWVSPEERRAALEERRLAAEERRAAAEGEARIREAEARARVAEAEARRAEAEADALQPPAFVTGVGGPWFAASSFTPFPYSGYAYSPYPVYPGGSPYPTFRRGSHSGRRSHRPGVGAGRPGFAGAGMPRYPATVGSAYRPAYMPAPLTTLLSVSRTR